MLKIFRNIRRKLLSENKTGKYLKYAIGEIVLVVIGILIALSINNWNENKKTNANIKNLLVALTNDLKQDTLLIYERLPFINKHYAFNETLRKRIAEPNATVDTLIKIMRYEFNPNWKAQLNYNTNAYSSLNQTGLLEQLPSTLQTKIKNF